MTASPGRKPSRTPPVSVGKAAHPLSGGGTPEAAQSELMQPPEPDFAEPAALEARDDLGTDVAPGRFDVPIDPHAPTRTTSSEGCSLPDEDMPEAVDFDGTA